MRGKVLLMIIFVGFPKINREKKTFSVNIYKWFETYRHVMTTEPFKQELFRELQIENVSNKKKQSETKMIP